jgi:hypothetical protein
MARRISPAFFYPPSLSLSLSLSLCLSFSTKCTAIKRNTLRQRVLTFGSPRWLRVGYRAAEGRERGTEGRKGGREDAVLNSAGYVSVQGVSRTRAGVVARVPSAWVYLISQSAQPLRSPRSSRAPLSLVAHSSLSLGCPPPPPSPFPPSPSAGAFCFHPPIRDFRLSRLAGPRSPPLTRPRNNPAAAFLRGSMTERRMAEMTPARWNVSLARSSATIFRAIEHSRATRTDEPRLGR